MILYDDVQINGIRWHWMAFDGMQQMITNVSTASLQLSRALSHRRWL
jgi:hypothetical protein